MQGALAWIRRRPQPAALLLLAAACYSTGLLYGLPQEFDPDENIFVESAGRMLSERTLDPGWYRHPASLLIYMLAALFAAVSGIAALSGSFENPAAAHQYFMGDPAIYLLTGRVLSVVIAIACLVQTSALMRRLSISPAARLLAMAALAVSPTIVQYAAIVRMDLMQALFHLVTLRFCLDALNGAAPRRSLIWASAFVGLATTTKYPGVIGAVPVAATLAILLARSRISNMFAARLLAICAAASVVVAFLSAPYLFLKFQDVLAGVAIEGRSSHLSATSEGLVTAAAYYMQTVLGRALSITGVAAALIGFAFLSRRDEGLVIAAFAGSFFIFLILMPLRWERWALPLVPVFAVAAAVGFDKIASGVRSLVSRPVMVWSVYTAMAAAVLAPLLLASAPESFARATNFDTRARAKSWIDTNIPSGSRILTESYAPSLDVNDYVLFHASSPGPLKTWSQTSDRRRPKGYYGNLADNWHSNPEGLVEQIRRNDIDYIALGSFQARFEAEPDSYPLHVEVYRLLDKEFPLRRQIEAQPRELGPRSLKILKVERRSQPAPPT